LAVIVLKPTQLMLVLSMVRWNNVQLFLQYNNLSSSSKGFFSLMRSLTHRFRAAHYSSSHFLSCYRLIFLYGLLLMHIYVVTCMV